MSVLWIIRLSLWGTSIFFSIIVLGLSAHLLWLEAALANYYNNHYYNPYNPYDPYGYDNYGITIPSYQPWTAMAVATAGLTLLTLPVFIGIDMGHTGAYTSMIAVEMVTVTILWVLWLTTASMIAQVSSQAGVDIISCGSNGPCNEFKAVEAFSFLCFFILLAYIVVLLVFTTIAHSRGNAGVWLQSVKETTFFTPPVNPRLNEKDIIPQPQYQSPPNFGTPAPNITPPPPTYPQYTGSPVPEQNPGFPGGQPVVGQV